MKKLKIAGYQGDGSVHTRSVKFFIDKVSDYFDISFDQDITEKGQKAASLIEMTMNNEIVWLRPQAAPSHSFNSWS